MLKFPALFDSRNTTKQSLEFFPKRKRVEPGQIWICKVGINLGSEVSKDGDFSRPVLVLKTGVGGDLVLVIPLTSKFHPDHGYQYIYFEEWEKYGLDMPSYFLLNQVKTVSVKRLMRKVNDIEKDEKKIPKVTEMYIRHLIDATYNFYLK